MRVSRVQQPNSEQLGVCSILNNVLRIHRDGRHGATYTELEVGEAEFEITDSRAAKKLHKITQKPHLGRTRQEAGAS